MTSAPGRGPGTPPSPSSTAATILLVGSIVTTKSAFARARPRGGGLAADLLREACRLVGAGVADATTKPALTRFAAIGQPMVPMPTKPRRSDARSFPRPSSRRATAVDHLLARP